MIRIVLLFCLALQSLDKVDAWGKIKGNVIEDAKTGKGYQVFIPWVDSSPKAKADPVSIEVESFEFKVECKEFENESPRAYVYNPGGILLDILVLAPIKEACAKITSYISPLKPGKIDENGKGAEKVLTYPSEMIYLMAGKNPRCVKRSYTIWEYTFMAYLDLDDYPKTECPDSLKSMVDGGAKSGGVVNLLSPGQYSRMDYTYNLDKKDEDPKTNIIEDFAGKWFKFMCIEDTLKDGSKLTTSVLIHEKYSGIVLDKYVLETCEFKDVNVNRRITFFGNDRFKIVFRKVDGNCYEIDITKLEKNAHMIYYDRTQMEKREAVRVRCPNKWTGDIGLNRNIPLYLRPFVKPKKYEGKPPMFL
ncbi:uncharacterized protein LOC129002812 [Macrosteles quadrilineatus]|uniref:uncharacterized protein LOC129002812 n=1 Tax=Macrosteles quadrilineatus TaxID=74068 RepID=UPI0023E1C38E|nr:uncharacterized protein LOC129002812 [Macrosteles quadrilineatus]